MDIDAAVMLLIAIACLLTSACIVLGGFLAAARKALRQARAAGRKGEEAAAAELEAEKTSHRSEIKRLEASVIEPLKAGQVTSFVVSLEDDKLSEIRLTGRNENLATVTTPMAEALEMVHPDDRSMVRNALIESLSRQRPLEIVFRGGTGDRERFFHARGRIANGRERGGTDLLGTIIEITEVQKFRARMISWMEVMESLIDLVPIGIMAVDAEGIVTVWNTSIAEATGIQPGAIIGCRAADIQEDNFLALVSAGRDSDDETAAHDVNLVHDNQTGRFKVTVLDVEDRSGKGGGQFRILTAVDAPRTPGTVSLEMEALGRLTAGIVHDFANLIHIIIGYADILNQDLQESPQELPPIVMEDLKQVQEAGARADALVRQLMVFGSPDKPSLRSCNIGTVVDDFMGLAKRVAGESIVIRLHPSPTPQSAIADPVIVGKIVLRLLLRIRQTLPEDGVVAISTKPIAVEEDWPVGNTGLNPGNYVKLSVSCSSVGWAADTADEAVQASIASMMAAQGGGMNIHESFDIGTTVSLYFRAAGADDATETAGNAAEVMPVERVEPSPAQYTRKATILVVEDDAPVRKLTAKALRKAGHVVLEACDGHEALDIFRDHADEIELLITDVIMPGMNGREVCDEINKVRPDIPVLFCSGYSSDLLQDEYMLNIHGLVIQKPYRSADLLATAARLLG